MKNFLPYLVGSRTREGEEEGPDQNTPRIEPRTHVDAS